MPACRTLHTKRWCEIDRIQIKFLGGFGNCLFQYACARKYAQMHDAVLETGDWAGRRIFGLQDSDWSRDLPDRNDGGCNLVRDPLVWGEVNVRLNGYFQFQPWLDILSRAELKRWFQLDSKWKPFLPEISNYLALHLRRGDSVNHPLYCVVSVSAYLEALAQYQLPADNLIWIQQEKPISIPEFEHAGLSFLADFICLMQASIILRANSTFSWWAATLSDADIYSPVVEALTGEQVVPFVPGNHPKCAHTRNTGVTLSDLYLPP